MNEKTKAKLKKFKDFGEMLESLKQTDYSKCLSEEFGEIKTLPKMDCEKCPTIDVNKETDR